ncbi:MAG: carbohydrate porin [Phycisphaerae bacterium]|nr:carbohydrate porin [Phycisphaerae bacterium]
MIRSHPLNRSVILAGRWWVVLGLAHVLWLATITTALAESATENSASSANSVTAEPASAAEVISNSLATSSSKSSTTQPASAPAASDSASEPESQSESEPFFGLQNHRLTGDWGGFRKKMEAKGFTFNQTLITNYVHNTRGGVSTRNSHRVPGKGIMELSLDTQAAGLWKGGKLYASNESGWSDGVDDKVGSLFSTNFNPIGNTPIRVRELFYEQKFIDDKLRFKFGRFDLGIDVDTNNYANWEVEQFTNTALIYTGNMPIPDFGLGAMVEVAPTDWMYVILGAVDSYADANTTGFRTTFHDKAHFFSALEFGLTPKWETRWGRLPGNYRFIVWYDPIPKERFGPSVDEEDAGGIISIAPRRKLKNNDTGFVFNMDQLIFKEKPNDDANDEGLGFFFRYGYAPGSSNVIEHFWSAGLSYKGLVPTRDHDTLAFGVAQGLTSHRLRKFDDQVARSETVYELYYRCMVFPWLAITPDLQYIASPGADKHARDSLFFGVRLVMTF